MRGGEEQEGRNSKQATERKRKRKEEEEEEKKQGKTSERMIYAQRLMGCESSPASVAHISASISIEMQVMPRHLFAHGDAFPATHQPIAEESAGSLVRALDSSSLSTPNISARHTLVKLDHHALDCQGSGEGVADHHPHWPTKVTITNKMTPSTW